jgi:two-component system sensor histidine kinase VicK
MLAGLYRRYLVLWRRLTAPLRRIEDLGARAQAQRLAVVVAWSMVGVLIVVGMRLLVLREIEFDLRPLGALMPALVGVFALTLTGRIVLARWIYLLLIHAVIYSMWALEIDQPAALTLGFLPLLVLITGTLFSFRAMVLNALVNQLIIYVLHLALPSAPYLGAALFMNGALSAPICVVTLARQREHQRLVESERRYRQLMELNFEPIAIVGFDRRIINVNPAFEALAGLPAAELIGRRIDDFATDESRPVIESVWGKREGHFVRLKVRSVDGDEFMAEVRTSVQVYDGQRVLVMIVRSLSQETAFERERREYELRYQALFEHSNDGIFIADLEGRCLTANQRGLDMLGVEMTEYQQHHAWDFVVPEEVEASRAVVERLKAGELLPSYQRRLQRKDGQIVPVEITPTLVRDSLGRPLHLQSVVRDITERLRGQEEHLALMMQRERTRLLRELIGEFSHHVRTPLSNIKNSAYLMGRLTDADAKQRHQQLIDGEVSRLVTLLDDLLMLTRLEAEIEEAAALPLDLNDLLSELMPYPDGHGQPDPDHQWRFIPWAQPVIVFGSRTRLRDAFQRLLDNARSYTPPNGEIVIQVEECEACRAARVRVQDSGMGIDAADVEHIFEPFYRSDAARQLKPLSTGLGLSICCRVIELHRGLITVQSAVGAGTTFDVWLPTDLKSALTHEMLAHVESCQQDG